MEEIKWVVASCQAVGLDDGHGSLITLSVFGFGKYTDHPSWSWEAVGGEPSMKVHPMSGGCGYPDPIAARTAAEYWLTVYRESAQSAAKFAGEDAQP